MDKDQVMGMGVIQCHFVQDADLMALLKENTKLKQQLKNAEMERKFLKKEQRTLQKKVRKVRMKQQRHAFPVALMVRLPHVLISRFYEWLKRNSSQQIIQRNLQTILVKIAHQETKESYGSIQLTKHLQSQWIQISEYAVH